MHKSRLAGFIIDCRTTEIDGAVGFWGAALGLETGGGDDPYRRLDGSPHHLSIEVQRVEHESRVHLDIETDDVDAEVARLEKLGAKRVAPVKHWWVMEAPTGHRFCVVPSRNIEGKPGVTTWP